MALGEVAGRLAERIEGRALPNSSHKLFVPERDDDDTDDTQALGSAEGQTFLIEYTNSKGEESRRRITVWQIELNTSGVPCLLARCHERNANRRFRVDRISCCIDFDGEVFEDVAAFLHDTFGMSIDIASAKPDAAGQQHWNDVLDAIRSDAILLVATAQSDGIVRPVEIATATEYLAMQAEKDGMRITDRDIERMAGYLRKIRPGVASIERALDLTVSKGTDSVEKALCASVAVMDADGNRHPAEIDFINSIAVDLIGMPVV